MYGNLDATAILFHDDPIRVRKHADGYVLSSACRSSPATTWTSTDAARRLFVRVAPTNGT